MGMGDRCEYLDSGDSFPQEPGYVGFDVEYEYRILRIGVLVQRIRQYFEFLEARMVRLEMQGALLISGVIRNESDDFRERCEPAVSRQRNSLDFSVIHSSEFPNVFSAAHAPHRRIMKRETRSVF